MPKEGMRRGDAAKEGRKERKKEENEERKGRALLTSRSRSFSFSFIC